MDNTPAARRRIVLLDTLRGLAVVLMLIFHIQYDLVFMFGAKWLATAFYWQMDYSWMATSLFVFLAGITVRFSRNAVKRGARLLCIAAGFTLVTAFIFPGSAIYWGVLHLISTGMLLYGLFSRQLGRLPWWLGLALSAVLFALTFKLQAGYVGFEGFSLDVPDILLKNDLLYPFGFVTGRFNSVDYLPILPWIFMFLCGVFAGYPVTDREAPGFACRDYCPPLTWLGKHSLIIYIVHQPVVYALLYVIYNFIPKA